MFFAFRGSLAVLFRLRHQHRKKDERRDSNGGQEQKSGRVAEILNDETRAEVAQAGADTDAQRDQSLGKIKTAGAAHQIGGHQDGYYAEDARRHAVEKLDCHHAMGVGSGREQQPSDT